MAILFMPTSFMPKPPPGRSEIRRILEGTNEKLTRNIEPANGTDFQLEELKRFIGGGYIEIVHLNNKEIMVLDEEGKNKNMPINYAATAYAWAHGFREDDTLAGPVVLCKETEVK